MFTMVENHLFSAFFAVLPQLFSYVLFIKPTITTVGSEKPIKVFRLPKWQLETKIVVIEWNCAGVLVVTWYRASSLSQTVLETPVLSCTGEFTKDSGQENWLRQEAFLLTNLPLY